MSVAFVVVAACSGASPQRGELAPDALVASRRQVQAITLCVTTEIALGKRFGPPMRDGRLHELRIQSWLLADGDVQRILAVALDVRGVVVDLLFDVPGVASW